jgi:hypothetical protein
MLEKDPIFNVAIDIFRTLNFIADEMDKTTPDLEKGNRFIPGWPDGNDAR